MVHPDKCKHARAKDAFEVIGAAAKDLENEETRAKLSFLLNHAKGEWASGKERESRLLGVCSCMCGHACMPIVVIHLLSRAMACAS